MAAEDVDREEQWFKWAMSTFGGNETRSRAAARAADAVQRTGAGFETAATAARAAYTDAGATRSTDRAPWEKPLLRSNLRSPTSRPMAGGSGTATPGLPQTPRARPWLRRRFYPAGVEPRLGVIHPGLELVGERCDFRESLLRPGGHRLGPLDPDRDRPGAFVLGACEPRSFADPAGSHNHVGVRQFLSARAAAAGRPAIDRVVYAASAADLAVVTTLVISQNGYSSPVFVFYFAAVLGLSVAFPTVLTALYTSAVVVVYGIVCLSTTDSTEYRRCSRGC